MDLEREIKVRDAIKYCIENFDSKTATNRIVEFWKDELKLQEVKNCRIANVSVSLLEEAANLVGNPGTNISGSCDIACMEWQEKYERWRNER